jgi:hypothetical protein
MSDTIEKPVFDYPEKAKIGFLCSYKRISYSYLFLREDYWTKMNNTWKEIFTKGNFKSSIDIGDKVYFIPDVNFPRYKFKKIAEENGASKVNNFKTSTVIVIEKDLFSNFFKGIHIDDDYKPVYFDDIDYYAVPHKEFVFSEIQDINEKLTTPDNKKYKKFALPNEFDKKVEIFEYIINNYQNFHFIVPSDLQSELSSISGLVPDQETLTTIDDLMKGSLDNVKLACEMLSNLSINDNPFILSYYITKYYSNLKKINNVNAKSTINNIVKFVNHENIYHSSVPTHLIIMDIINNFKHTELSDLDKLFIKQKLEEYYNTYGFLKKSNIKINYE